jgi:hypothetical protein
MAPLRLEPVMVTRALLTLAATLVPWTLAAEPRLLTERELGGVTAGLFDTYYVMPVVVVNSTNNTVVNAANSHNVSGTGVSNVIVDNAIRISPTDQVGSLSGPVAVVPGPSSVSGPAVAAPAPPTMVAPAAQPPVWIPWAAELRPALGLR